MCSLSVILLATRRRFADAEQDSRLPQGTVHILYDRVCATKHAPRRPCRLLQRRHSFAEIAERGAGVLIDRLRELALPVRKSTGVTVSDALVPSSATPSSRCRVDGVEVYAANLDERAVNLIPHRALQ